jgi:hypothetical protein
MTVIIILKNADDVMVFLLLFILVNVVADNPR